MLQAISKFVTGSDTAAAPRDNLGGRYDQQGPNGRGFDAVPVSTAPHGKIAPPAYTSQKQYNDHDTVGPPAHAAGGAGSAYYIQQQQYAPQRGGGAPYQAPATASSRYLPQPASAGQYQQPWGATTGRSNQDMYVAH